MQIVHFSSFFPMTEYALLAGKIYIKLDRRAKA